MIFQQMRLGTREIPHFHVNLAEQSISYIIFITQGHLQGQKSISRSSKQNYQIWEHLKSGDSFYGSLT